MGCAIRFQLVSGAQPFSVTMKTRELMTASDEAKMKNLAGLKPPRRHNTPVAITTKGQTRAKEEVTTAAQCPTPGRPMLNPAVPITAANTMMSLSMRGALARLMRKDLANMPRKK